MKQTQYNNRHLGALGERKAVEFLRAEGYEILRQNYSCRSGEIDIIAHPRGENIICFAEVKTRRNRDYGRPAEAVTPAKQRHIRTVATFFLLKEWDNIGVDQDTDFRFDVLEVDFASGAPRVNHIPAAFF
jgi:putative endonuclease